MFFFPHRCDDVRASRPSDVSLYLGGFPANRSVLMRLTLNLLVDVKDAKYLRVGLTFFPLKVLVLQEFPKYSREELCRGLF